MITRENYEEFFLLYVDGELPMTVRTAVEQFVADNPDLREELTALLQCRVQPDQDPGFRDKESLFQYESSMLSYVDGELDDSERSSVEAWVRRSPLAAEDLRQLQMTVSRPDPAVFFPGKESLYRGGRRRVVFLPWLRAGIAAAVLGGVALLLLRHSPDEATARDTKKVVPVVTSVVPDTLNSTVKDEQTATVEDSDGRPKDRQASLVAAVKDRRARTKVRQAGVATTKDRGMQQKEPKETTVDVTSPVRTEVAVAEPHPLKEQPPVVEQTKLTTAVAAVIIPKEQSSFATQALLQQEQDNSIAEAPVVPVKNKLRGLFRKVGRAFGKTAESDGDGQREVLISAFQVALK